MMYRSILEAAFINYTNTIISDHDGEHNYETIEMWLGDQLEDVHIELTGQPTKNVARTPRFNTLIKLIKDHNIILIQQPKKEAIMKTKTTKKAKASVKKASVKGSCAIARDTFDAIKKKDNGAVRKDYIEAAIKKGVHPSTASTQFSRWNKAA